MFRVAYDNLARGATPATASAGSTGAGTAAGRALTSALSDRWRPADGVTATWLEVVLPSAGSIDAVALHGALGEALQWRIRIGTGDLTDPGDVVHDTGVSLVSAGAIAPYGLAVLFLPAPVTAQAIRFDLSDAAGFEVGRVWAGKSWAAGIAPDPELGAVDHSTRSRSTSGALFVEQRPISRRWSVVFPALTTAEAAGARSMQRIAGASREVLACLDDQSASIGADTMLATLADPAAPRGHPTAPGYWTLSLILEERL